MKKCLLITDKYPPHRGGSSVIFYNLYKNNNAVTIITRTPFINIPKIRMPLLYLFLFFQALFFCFKNKKIIIHAGQVIETGTTAYIMKLLFNIPYCVHVFGEEISICSKKRLRKKIMFIVLKNAEKIFSVSNYTKNYLMKLGIENQKIKVLYPGVDNKQFTVNYQRMCDTRTKLGIMPDDFVILSLGRIVERKGYHIMVHIFEELCEKFKDKKNLKYIISGQGAYKKELENIISKKKYKNNIVLLDSVSHKDTVLFYEICNVFVMLAQELENGDLEGLGLVVLEAQACGKPVIVGRSGGTSETLKHGETGFLVNACDKEEIFKRLEYLILNKDICRTMGKSAWTWIKQDFDWSKARKILSI